jgi:hypothetical protein
MPRFDTALVKQAECWLTDPWAPRSILKCELLTRHVIDPCCGTGILGDALKEAGYTVWESDLHDWGRDGAETGLNWLTDEPVFKVDGNTVFMNPPFSLAREFVLRAFELGARKVVCFQSWSWSESSVRRDYWDSLPPQRTYVCGDRATPRLASLTDEEWKAQKGGMNKAHGWYVWEKNQPAGPLMGRVYKVMP